MVDRKIEHRVALGEEEFRKLVAGEQVDIFPRTGGKISIILSDIGFYQMEKAIADSRSQHGS